MNDNVARPEISENKKEQVEKCNETMAQNLDDKPNSLEVDGKSFADIRIHINQLLKAQQEKFAGEVEKARSRMEKYDGALQSYKEAVLENVNRLLARNSELVKKYDEDNRKMIEKHQNDPMLEWKLDKNRLEDGEDISPDIKIIEPTETEIESLKMIQELMIVRPRYNFLQHNGSSDHIEFTFKNPNRAPMQSEWNLRKVNEPASKRIRIQDEEGEAADEKAKQEPENSKSTVENNNSEFEMELANFHIHGPEQYWKTKGLPKYSILPARLRNVMSGKSKRKKTSDSSNQKGSRKGSAKNEVEIKTQRLLVSLDERSDKILSDKKMLNEIDSKITDFISDHHAKFSNEFEDIKEEFASPGCEVTTYEYQIIQNSIKFDKRLEELADSFEEGHLKLVEIHERIKVPKETRRLLGENKAFEDEDLEDLMKCFTKMELMGADERLLHGIIDEYAPFYETLITEQIGNEDLSKEWWQQAKKIKNWVIQPNQSNQSVLGQRISNVICKHHKELFEEIQNFIAQLKAYDGRLIGYRDGILQNISLFNDIHAMTAQNYYRKNVETATTFHDYVPEEEEEEKGDEVAELSGEDDDISQPSTSGYKPNDEK
uniref:DUF4780 domain-containing protein n=1 Tax=Caenorhabditis tropicalis TaxID=1561998 RepID=A0A1I7U0U3_9PELO